MRLELHLVELHGVGQRERERERSVVRTEEVVAPGRGPHAPRRACAAHGHAARAAALQQHVRRLRRRVAARHRACDHLPRHSRYRLHAIRARDSNQPTTVYIQPAYSRVLLFFHIKLGRRMEPEATYERRPNEAKVSQ